MADAYKLKADASFPKALRKQGEDVNGNPTYLTEGRNYAAGSYVYENDLTPRDREIARNGGYDRLLEAGNRADADAYYELRVRGVFIAEHEAESVVLEQYGHEVVPPAQALAMKAAGSDAAADAQSAALADGAGDRPNLTRAEYPSLAEVSRGETRNVPKNGAEHIDADRLAESPSSSVRGVEQPPGLQVGEAKAEQEGATPRAKRRPGRPKKPAAAVKKPAPAESK